MPLTAEFSEATSTAAAIQALRAQGLTADSLDVFSSEPIGFPPGVLDRPSRMSRLAVAGAVTVCLLAVGFVYYTQHAYPLVTGGMPLFSFWATGVIFYEMTLLGAIGAIFVVFLWEGGLLRRRRPAPPPSIEPGRIYVRVNCEPDQLADAAVCLYRTGAARVSKS